MTQPNSPHMHGPLRIAVCPRCHRPVPITDAGDVANTTAKTAAGAAAGQTGRAGHVMTLAGLACHTPPADPPRQGAGVAR